MVPANLGTAGLVGSLRQFVLDLFFSLGGMLSNQRYGQGHGLEKRANHSWARANFFCRRNSHGWFGLFFFPLILPVKEVGFPIHGLPLLRDQRIPDSYPRT